MSNGARARERVGDDELRRAAAACNTFLATTGHNAAQVQHQNVDAVGFHGEPGPAVLMLLPPLMRMMIPPDVLRVLAVER